MSHWHWSGIRARDAKHKLWCLQYLRETAVEAFSKSTAHHSKNKWTPSQNGHTTWYKIQTSHPWPWGISNILAIQEQLHILVCIRSIARFECVMTKDDLAHTLYLFVTHLHVSCTIPTSLLSQSANLRSKRHVWPFVGRDTISNAFCEATLQYFYWMCSTTLSIKTSYFDHFFFGLRAELILSWWLQYIKNRPLYYASKCIGDPYVETIALFSNLIPP